jgi:hypothetical protein
MSTAVPNVAFAVVLGTRIDNCFGGYFKTVVKVDGVETAALVLLGTVSDTTVTFDLSPATFNVGSVVSIYNTVLTGFV